MDFNTAIATCDMALKKTDAREGTVTQWMGRKPQMALRALGALIRTNRLAKNLSMRTLGPMARSSFATVTRLETGTNHRAEFLSLISICYALGITPEMIANVMRKYEIGNLKFPAGSAIRPLPRTSIFYPLPPGAPSESIWSSEEAKAGMAALGRAFMLRRMQMDVGLREISSRAMISGVTISRFERGVATRAEFFPLVAVGEVLGFSLPEMVRIISDGARKPS